MFPQSTKLTKITRDGLVRGVSKERGGQIAGPALSLTKGVRRVRGTIVYVRKNKTVFLETKESSVNTYHVGFSLLAD